MSPSSDVAQLAESILYRHSAVSDVAEAGQGWLPTLWLELERSGLTVIGSGADRGGLDDWAAMMRAAGKFAAPVPVVESTLAGLILVRAELAILPGALTIGTAGLNDEFVAVPWARHCEHAVLVTDERVDVVALTDCEVIRDHNLAGEPRDTLIPRAGAALASSTGSVRVDDVLQLGALARALQIGGALERVLALTVDHARTRKQFGRPIGEFQAVQEKIALLAAEVAAAQGALTVAMESVGADVSRSCLAVGSAKIRCSAAAGYGAQLAHQVHGAIGYTYEHPLRLFTTRLWSWRDEFGSERWWSERVGAELLSSRGDHALWEQVCDV